jgi:hypothetical protein
MPLDHVKAMRKILGEAGGMLDAGDDRLRRSFLEEADEQIQIEIARAQAHFLGSIARSLLLLGTMIVDEAEDASVLPLYHLSVAISGPIAAFKSAYVSGVWLGAEVGRDPVAAARLARWLEETIPSGGRTEDDREFVERLTKTLLATP